jgi:hypothetical protein
LRLQDQFDHQQHEQDRDRVVEPRLALEGARQPQRQARTAQQREDCRPVGRGQDRPQEESLEQRELEQPGRGEARDRGRRDGADERQAQSGAQHSSDVAPPGDEAALEQDQEQGDRSQQPRELVVVERDPAEPIASNQHPESHEQDQRGQPYARRER